MHASFSAGCSETWAWRGATRSAAHAATVSARTVVQVMELAHERDSRERHLCKRRSRQLVHGLGGDRLSQRVHLLSPGPEGARGGGGRRAALGTGALRAPPQRPLECVGMGI